MQYERGFLSAETASRLLNWMTMPGSFDWHHETFQIYGRVHQVPRPTGWCGDPGVSYVYSGMEHRCTHWLAPLDEIRQKLQQQLQTRFNLVIANRYLDGSQHMGWHRDDEPGCMTTVASVSLGATRRFRSRPGAGVPSEYIDLEHGSLLVFDAFQQHRLCATRKPVGERINLTFRHVEQ